MNLLLLAIAPILVIVIYIYLKDKYEREPKLLVIKTILLGAIVSILITTILYMVTNRYVPLLNEESIFNQFLKTFFIIGLIEEFSKYVIVRYYNQPKAEFNEPFDGIVYAVMVSMGFALTENIMYVFEYGVSTGIARAFTAVPAHATFGVLMGYFMGLAKFSNKKWLYNLVGLSLAIIFHGAYDFFLFLPFIPGIWIGAFVSLIIGIVLSSKAIKAHQKNSNFK